MAVWRGSSEAEIDASNRSAPMMAMPSGWQNWERRVQEDPMLLAEENPALLKTAMAARDEAVRYQGLQEYEQLVRDGATPAEAYRRAAPKLMFKSPTAMAAVMRSTAPIEPPREAVFGGQPFVVTTGRDGSPRLTQVKTPTAPWRMPPAFQNEITEQNEALRDLRSQLRTAREEMIGDESAIQAQIDEATKRRAEIFRRPEANPNVDQKVFEGIADRWSPPMPDQLKSPPNEQTSAPMSDSDKVVVMKDGKKYRLPKSQLKEAEGEGYKLVE